MKSFCSIQKSDAASEIAAIGPRGVASIILAVALTAGWAGCGEQDKQIKELSNSFQTQLDAKNKELAALQQTEKTLTARIQELEARSTPEAGTTNAGGVAVDTNKLAVEIVGLLEPKIHSMLASAATITTPAPPTRSGAGPTPFPLRFDQPSTTSPPPAPASSSKPGGVTVRPSTEDGPGKSPSKYQIQF
jgi:hypothetical protein